MKKNQKLGKVKFVIRCHEPVSIKIPLASKMSQNKIADISGYWMG